LIELKIYDDLAQREVETNFQQRGFVPVRFKRKTLCPKKVLPFQPDSKGKWTPGYEGPCAMTFTTMDGGKLARPMKADAVKKYFVKKYKAR